MKIVVIGGTGLIGSKAVAILCQGGHEVVAASPKNGVNSITGEGSKSLLKAGKFPARHGIYREFIRSKPAAAHHGRKK